MKHVKVTICTGTTCYVMGASELLTLEDHLAPEIREYVEIIGSQCLDQCKDDHTRKTPIVKIDEELLFKVTLHNLVVEVERRVRG